MWLYRSRSARRTQSPTASCAFAACLADRGGVGRPLHRARGLGGSADRIAEVTSSSSRSDSRDRPRLPSVWSASTGVLAEAKTTHVATAAAATRTGRPTASDAPSRPRPQAHPAERERAQALHAKGLELLDRGNVYAARKFFERAAEIGMAQGAQWRRAGTYDPDELAKLRVVGLAARREGRTQVVRAGARARRGRGRGALAAAGSRAVVDLLSGGCRGWGRRLLRRGGRAGHHRSIVAARQHRATLGGQLIERHSRFHRLRLCGGASGFTATGFGFSVSQRLRSTPQPSSAGSDAWASQLLLPSGQTMRTWK